VEVRTIKKFLFLPKIIKGEIKWLVLAKFTQRLLTLTSLPPEGLGEYKYKQWVDWEWVL
jgi:hypothetical protein